MLRKISLGNCTDSYIPRIFELVNKGEVKVGQKLSLPNNKTYLPGYNVVVSDTKKEGLGNVKKLYEKLDDGYIHLTKRVVENERGAYSRSIDYARGIEKVSLGGQPAFEQQADGDTYNLHLLISRKKSPLSKKLNLLSTILKDMVLLKIIKNL